MSLVDSGAASSKTWLEITELSWYTVVGAPVVDSAEGPVSRRQIEALESGSASVNPGRNRPSSKKKFSSSLILYEISSAIRRFGFLAISGIEWDHSHGPILNGPGGVPLGNPLVRPGIVIHDHGGVHSC